MGRRSVLYIFRKNDKSLNGATAWQNQQNDIRAQRQLRSVWAFTQLDQSLGCALNGKLRTHGFFMWTLGLRCAHMPFCWFFNVVAQVFIRQLIFNFLLSFYDKFRTKSTYAEVHDPHTNCLKCFP